MFSTLRTFTLLSLSNFFTPLRASVIYPPVDLSAPSVGGFVVGGASLNDQSGGCVTRGGDLNGDGWDDIVVGSPNALNGAGAINILFTPPGGFISAVDLSMPPNGFVIPGEAADDGFGFAIATCDINGDGFEDLLASSPFATTINGFESGKVYGMYGPFNTTAPSLATLSGNKGFVAYGASVRDRLGYSIAGGRVNGDPFCDFLLGSPNIAGSSGKAYLVYGNQTFSTPLQPATVNGNNGTTFFGLSGYQSGYAVTMGDVNGDTFSDPIIASYTASLNSSLNNAGLISVAFGANTTSFPPTLNLSSAFNGINGFNIWGVSNDKAGKAVAAGDTNGDGCAEIMIGSADASPQGRSNAGRTYIYYGKPGGFSPTFLLANLLNGTGFKIDGENVGDGSGSSVAIPGDINGDGFKDLLIGAPSASLNGLLAVGRTYVVYGANNKRNGTLTLSSTASSEFLVLNGKAPGAGSGSSVAGAGDINRDGRADFIIGSPGDTPYGRNGAGSSSVILGDSLQVTENDLTIRFGEPYIFTLSNLNASTPYNPGAIQYTITQLQHGQFEYTDQPNIAISSFSSQNIMDGRIQFVPDGTKLAPSYSVAANRVIVATTPEPANVTFLDEPQIVVNNTIPVNQGETTLVSATMFSGTNPFAPEINGEITYFITSCSYGAFSPPSSFTQAQIENEGVYFTPYSANSPQCSFTMFLRGVSVGPISVVFDFRAIPILEQNHVNICQGQTETVNSTTMLRASQPGTNSSDTLVFSVSNIQYGHFEHVIAPGVSILNFTQADINSGSIQVTQDGSENALSFILAIGDGRVKTSSYPAGVYFTRAPELLTNALALNQGSTVFLTQKNLNAVNRDKPAEDVVYTVDNVEGGVFIEVNTSGKFKNITQFPQSKVTANKITFESDGSANLPSYDVVVANQCSQSAPFTAAVDCNFKPQLINNQLTITDGQPVTLNLGYLSATDDKTLFDNLGFTMRNVTDGHFELITSSGTDITVFSGASLRLGQVLFIPDNNGAVPAYHVSVGDGVLSSEFQPALVTLKTTPSSTIINTYTNDSNTAANTLQNSLISFFAVTVPLGIIFWLGKRYADKRMNDKVENILKLDYSAVQKADEAWKKNTIFPVLKEVFKRIQTATGCCGYRDEQATRGYITCVEKLLGKLKELGVTINLNELPEHERNGFKNAIADEVQKRAEWGKPPRSAFSKCCAALLSASSGPVFTPREFQKTAAQIAEVIAATYKKEQDEAEIDGIRKSIYDGSTARPVVREKQGYRGNHEAYIELDDLSDGAEQKFASEQEAAFAVQLAQLAQDVAELKKRQEEIETNHDGRLVQMGVRTTAVSVEQPSPQDIALTVVPKGTEKARVA